MQQVERVRAYALAKDLKVEAKEVLAACAELGFANVKNQLSSLEPEQADAIRKRFRSGPKPSATATVPKPASPAPLSARIQTLPRPVTSSIKLTPEQIQKLRAMERARGAAPQPVVVPPVPVEPAPVVGLPNPVPKPATIQPPVAVVTPNVEARTSPVTKADTPAAPVLPPVAPVKPAAPISAPRSVTPVKPIPVIGASKSTPKPPAPVAPTAEKPPAPQTPAAAPVTAKLDPPPTAVALVPAAREEALGGELQHPAVGHATGLEQLVAVGKTVGKAVAKSVDTIARCADINPATALFELRKLTESFCYRVLRPESDREVKLADHIKAIAKKKLLSPKLCAYLNAVRDTCNLAAHVPADLLDHEFDATDVDLAAALLAKVFAESMQKGYFKPLT